MTFGAKVAVTVALIWTSCGVMTTGMLTAHFTYEFPDTSDVREELGVATIISLCGPLATLVTFSFTGFAEHGMCWTESGCKSLRGGR